ncbi:MAG: DUF2857 family protein [Gammaproteobacteria bacterium]|nr:DUF2857 family protein [Gammaproteobacteria bacterium]
MALNKESELNNAILLYICECQVHGDFMALNALGIGGEILHKIKGMTITEILHTSNIRSSFIKSIQIDSEILGHLLNRASNEKKSENILNQLILRGAPLQLVKDLNGINAVEFSTLRRLQNVEYRGRTNLPTFEQEQIIFNACKGIDITNTGNLTGEQWIDLSEKTDLPIRLIYKVICENEEVTREQIN